MSSFVLFRVVGVIPLKWLESVHISSPSPILLALDRNLTFPFSFVSISLSPNP